MILAVTRNPRLDRTRTVPQLEFDAVLRPPSVCFGCSGKDINVSRGLNDVGMQSTAKGNGPIANLMRPSGLQLLEGHLA